MRVKLQKISIDIEKSDVTNNANDGCPEQLLGVVSGSLTSQHQPTVKTLPDQEYVESMEERYGIGEEGIF